MKKILVVDDELDICRLLKFNLEKEGFMVDTVADAIEAMKRLRKSTFDLIVLDLMLPEMDGLQFCKTIKEEQSLKDIPVIMLTAKDEEIDRVLGLELGADDYITKPFSMRELIARVKAVLRRMSRNEREVENILQIGDIQIDRERYRVKIAEKEIQLSVKEFKLLVFLATNPGKIYNREQLLDRVWGDDVYVTPRAVDVYIRRLREKIEKNPEEPELIKTRRGIGYYFEQR